MKPVIYTLAPIGVGGALEANGEVHFFCSEACRAQFPTATLGEVGYAYGDSEDYVADTVCDMCGTAL